MSGGAVVVVAQNRAMRRFAEAGATAPERAVRMEELGVRRSWVIGRMIVHGVFVPVGDERFYIDLDAAARFRTLRFRRMLIFLAVCLLLGTAVWLLLHGRAPLSG